MKKAAVFLMILTLSVSSAACGNKEKDDNQADAKTEQSQNADNSKDNDKSDTQTKEADNKSQTKQRMFYLSPTSILFCRLTST